MGLWMVWALSSLPCSNSNEWTSIYAQTFSKGLEGRWGKVWEALLCLKPPWLGSQSVAPEEDNESTEA